MKLVSDRDACCPNVDMWNNGADKILNGHIALDFGSWFASWLWKREKERGCSEETIVKRRWHQRAENETRDK